MNDIDVETEMPLKERPPKEVVAYIASHLGETQSGPYKQIERIVWALGRTQALALLTQAQQIEAGEGLLVPDGSRRRTIGGVFFHLANTTGVVKPGKSLQRFSHKSGVERPASPKKQPRIASVEGIAPFGWDEREGVIQEIGEEKGKAGTVKITLIGTLGKYVDKGSCVVGVMQHSGEKLPALPKGVPAPQAAKTNYVVYIGTKQWKSIAEAVKDPEDALIVEGFPQIDAKNNAISVFASNVSSKKLQAAKRQS